MHTFYRACRANFQALQPAVGRLRWTPGEFYTRTQGLRCPRRKERLQTLTELQLSRNAAFRLFPFPAAC